MQTTVPNNESIQVQQEGHWNWQTVQYTLHCPKMVREEAEVHSPLCATITQKGKKRSRAESTHFGMKLVIKSLLLFLPAFPLHHLVSDRRAPYGVPLAVMFGQVRVKPGSTTWCHKPMT